jgi:hypothetical protein
VFPGSSPGNEANRLLVPASAKLMCRSGTGKKRLTRGCPLNDDYGFLCEFTSGFTL